MKKRCNSAGAMPCNLVVHVDLRHSRVRLGPLPRFELVACHPEVDLTDGYLHNSVVACEISRALHTWNLQKVQYSSNLVFQLVLE